MKHVKYVTIHNQGEAAQTYALDRPALPLSNDVITLIDIDARPGTISLCTGKPESPEEIAAIAGFPFVAVYGGSHENH